MKKLLVVGVIVMLAIILLIAIAFGYLYSNRNELTRKGTERALEYVLAVDVDVQSADVDIRSQRVTINGIEIDNPDGYDTEHAMRFGKVSVQADIRSFNTQQPVINEVLVEESDIIMEAKIGGKTNLQVLMDNARTFSESRQTEPAPEEAQKKYLIKQVNVNATTVKVALPMSGGQTVAVQIPDVHMEDVGGGDGATPAEAMQEFIAVLLEQIREMGGGIIPADILNSIDSTLKNLPGDLKKNLEGIFGGASGTLGNAGESVGEAVEGAGKAAEGAVKDVQDTIGGIFGKKKTEE